MKKISLLAVVTIGFLTYGFGQTYSLDKFHSRVGFSAKHFGISNVEGNFKVFDASLDAKKPDLTDAVISFSAQVGSIDTDVEYRDNDLKSEAYFDVAKYPNISFRSISFKKVSGKNYLLNGNLSMHGVTKLVVFKVLFNGIAVTAMKKPTAGFTITGSVNRLDYGIGKDPLSTGVSNEITITSNIEFTINKP